MNDNATSGKEGGESNDELRARWEGANFGMTVCRNGVVNVENRNYNESGHIYSVRVEAGHTVGCSCPHAVHRDAHCKHQVAVEDRPLVVSSATAANASYAPVATDGGVAVEGEENEDTRATVRAERETARDEGATDHERDGGALVVSCGDCAWTAPFPAETRTCPNCGSVEIAPVLRS